MRNDATQLEIDNIPTGCTIPWSEFHYHLFSHLIDMEDRDLARDIELLIFPASWKPDQLTLDRFLSMFMRTEDPSEFDEPARSLVREIGQKFPNLRLNTR